LFFMYCLCRKQEEYIFLLFFDCFVTSHVWNYTKQVFPEFFYFSINDIIDFLMLVGSSLVNLVRLATITYSIWMTWRVRNHVRFQVNISICSAIQIVKGFIRMTSNSFRKHMCDNIMTSLIWIFLISSRVVGKRSLLFRLFRISSCQLGKGQHWCC